jgi:hypothetical protein
MNLFLYLLVSGLLSGAVIAAALGFVLSKRTDIFRSHRTWKERAVADLLAPIHMHLQRTRSARDNFSKNKTFIEGKVLRESNLAVRDLLLKNAYLIPPDLRNDASRLVNHYDRWFEEYERLRKTQNPNLDSLFDLGDPVGFPFPSDAEERFHESFKKHWNELYQNAT